MVVSENEEKEKLVDNPFITSTQDIVTEISNGFLELTGYSKDELVNKDIFEVFTRLLRLSKKIFEKIYIKDNIECYIFTKSLEVREVIISVIEGQESKKLIYTVVEKRNSRLDDKLVFEEQLFKDNIVGCSIYSVPDLILLKSNEKYLDFMDPSYNTMEKCIGLSLWESVPGYEGSNSEELFLSIIKTGIPNYYNEFKYDHYDRGITYWDGSIIPIFLEDKKFKYIFQTCTEITNKVTKRNQIEEQAKIIKFQNEQLNHQNELLSMSEERSRALAKKLREVDLRQSEERFYKIFNNSPDIINIIRMEDDKYIEINQKFIDVFGYNREEVLGHTPSELILPHGKNNVKNLYKQLDECGSLNNFEINFRNKSGQVINLLASTEIIDFNGEICRLTVMKDVTKEKHVEAEMARLDRLNLVGQMAAGIGHEIRNPMTTVKGFLQLLSDKAECSKYNDYYTLMIDELDRANSIITEFLCVAKDKVAELETQSLNKIVENIIPLIQADATISDKYINMELEEVSEIPLDKKEIHQLILNLVQNGLQAMSLGGNMKIRTFMTNEEIVLVVQDDGKGIEQEVLEKIGTPFFTTKENGTGLGLAVCYSIATRHNAKIDIKTDSTGTTIFVRFKK